MQLRKKKKKFKEEELVKETLSRQISRHLEVIINLLRCICSYFYLFFLASKSDKPRQPKERTTKKEKVVEPAPIVAAPVAQAIPLPPPDHEFKIDNPDDIALFEGIDPYEDDPLMFVTGSSLQLQANSQQTKKVLD